MMKTISILGSGKTGHHVIEALKDHHSFKLGEVFNSKNFITLEKLKEVDGLIVFVTAEILGQLIPILIKANKPIVLGTTGFDYKPYEADISLNQSPWIVSSNFSLSVQVLRRLMTIMNQSRSLFPEHNATLHEIHHTHKKDAPSGTAVSMQKWFGENILITSERHGDVVGTHQFEFKTNNETIKISHEAHNRKIFADGAIRAMEMVFQYGIPKGFFRFEDLIDQTVFK